MRQLTPRWIALLAITAITIYVVWLIFSPFLNVLLWAVVLSVIAAPLNLRLRRWTSPTVSAMLTLLVVLIVIVLPAGLIITAAATHSDEAIRTVQEGASKLTDPNASHIRALARHDIDVQRFLQSEKTKEQLGEIGKWIANQSVGIVSGGILIVVQFLLVLFTTYYLLRDSGRLLDGFSSLLPLTRSQTDLMVQNVKTIISASLKGTVLISAIQGTLGGLAFWFLGIPAPLLWGAIMFLSSMIPVVGSSIIWGPAVLYLLASGSWGKAVFLLAWGAGVIAMVDNLLRPTLVGSKTRMHELTVFFSVLGGLKLFGPVGIVAGPIVVGVAQGLLRIFMADVSHEESAGLISREAPKRPQAEV